MSLEKSQQSLQAWTLCLLAASFLFVILPGCSNNNVPLPRLAADATVLAFGDSITYGTGVKTAQSYPVRLAQLIDREVVSAGVPGETSEQGRQRLPGVLAEVDPDLVILCLGGNDFLRRKNPQETRANLAAMIEQVQQRNIPVVLLAVPQFKLGFSDAPMYAELAERFEIPVADDVLSDVLGDSSLKSDRVHPNAEGYRLVAERVAQLLRERGAVDG